MPFYFSKQMPKIIFFLQKRNYSDTQNSQGSKQTREIFFAKYDNRNCRYGRLFLRKLLMLFRSQLSCTKWSCKTLFEMEDTDILYTNNHVVTYVPDFQTKPSVSKPSR
jgi:hypothetical protein